jgi:PPK2 family polyphosphate:nucleotide phosphotransferase
MDLCSRLRVKPGSNFKLADHDPRDTLGFKDKDAALGTLEDNVDRLDNLQYKLWAENSRAVLVVLQGMDTSGKDGTIRHVMTGFDPQGCRVVSFKKPNEEEMDHGFLWRIHVHAPAKGEVAIFNRSHYEDVLITRVHGWIDRDECKRRYANIRDWERYLAETGTRVLKFCLHISKDEQKQRLEERLEDPSKHWKFSEQDLAERKLWDKYQHAYQDALEATSTDEAPWYVIPSDRKWVRNLAVAEILVETLEKMAPKVPSPELDVSKMVIE